MRSYWRRWSLSPWPADSITYRKTSCEWKIVDEGRGEIERERENESERRGVKDTTCCI